MKFCAAATLFIIGANTATINAFGTNKVFSITQALRANLKSHPGFLNAKAGGSTLGGSNDDAMANSTDGMKIGKGSTVVITEGKYLGHIGRIIRSTACYHFISDGELRPRKVTKANVRLQSSANLTKKSSIVDSSPTISASILIEDEHNPSNHDGPKTKVEPSASEGPSEGSTTNPSFVPEHVASNNEAPKSNAGIFVEDSTSSEPKDRGPASGGYLEESILNAPFLPEHAASDKGSVSGGYLEESILNAPFLPEHAASDKGSVSGGYLEESILNAPFRPEHAASNNGTPKSNVAAGSLEDWIYDHRGLPEHVASNFKLNAEGGSPEDSMRTSSSFSEHAASKHDTDTLKSNVGGGTLEDWVYDKRIVPKGAASDGDTPNPNTEGGSLEDSTVGGGVLEDQVYDTRIVPKAASDGGAPKLNVGGGCLEDWVYGSRSALKHEASNIDGPRYHVGGGALEDWVYK